MESSNKVTQLINRILMVAVLLVLAWAAYAQFSSRAALALADRKNETVYTLLLTKPAMLVSYNPSTGKATVRTIRETRNQKDYKERAQQLLKSAGVELDEVRYYVPQELDRKQFWDNFKYRLTAWPYNPFYVVSYLFDYVKARHDKRTDLTIAEFVLLSMELSQTEISDFTVRIAQENTKKRGKASKTAPQPDIQIEDMAPLAVDDRPLIVEILNASGKKGAAHRLTQYLRNLNEIGLLRVDVLQFDNYPGGYLETTRVVDYSGRLIQVKQLSTTIGSNNEIISEKQGASICDVRVIIGKDFQMPL